MKKTLLTGIAVLLLVTGTAHAIDYDQYPDGDLYEEHAEEVDKATCTSCANAHTFYTECVAEEDAYLVQRPNGPIERNVTKGDHFIYQTREGDWGYVIHRTNSDPVGIYGWIRRNVLTDCQAREGTP